MSPLQRVCEIRTFPAGMPLPPLCHAGPPPHPPAVRLTVASNAPSHIKGRQVASPSRRHTSIPAK